MVSRIEDYALIGDCETAALVSRNGSIDWLCWPRFDSGACFAALLGDANNGRWQIAPAAASGTDANVRVRRRYLPNTLILETKFATPDGSAAVLVDFMPLRQGGLTSHLARLVVGKSGTVPMRTELIVRFGYGGWIPWVTQSNAGELLAIAGPDLMVLRTPVGLARRGVHHGRRFHRLGRAAGALRSDLWPIPSAASRAGGCRSGAAVDARILAVVGEYPADH